MTSARTPTTLPEDELLAIRCQLGERAAFDELVERWHQPLWKYVRRLVGDDATTAELVQEVWLGVLRGLNNLRDPARLRAWLFGIARRVVMGHLRRTYADVIDPTADLTEIADDVDANDLNEEIAQMHAEIGALPVIEREALVLFYLRELTLQQIAEVVSVPVGTVKSRLHRARSELRRRLVDKGVEP